HSPLLPLPLPSQCNNAHSKSLSSADMTVKCIVYYIKTKKTFLFKTSWPLLELQKKIKECFDDLLEDIELEYIQIVPNGADYKIDDNEFLSELWDLAKKDNSRHSCITFAQQDFSSYKSLSKVLRTFGINDISSLVDIPQFTLGKYECYYELFVDALLVSIGKFKLLS
ncbi:18547_t:CDS:2, partial [Entrophospora sp. SA101]